MLELTHANIGAECLPRYVDLHGRFSGSTLEKSAICCYEINSISASL